MTLGGVRFIFADTGEDKVDETPVYQEHLAKINILRHTWPELLLEGRYTATDGFTCSNANLSARSYTSGNRMAVVVTNIGTKTQSGKIIVPGYKLEAARHIGGKVTNNKVTLKQNEIAVLVFSR